MNDHARLVARWDVRPDADGRLRLQQRWAADDAASTAAAAQPAAAVPAAA